MTTTTITTIVNDIKQVAHQGIAAGVGALGAGLTADALQIADDITSGNLDGWSISGSASPPLSGSQPGPRPARSSPACSEVRPRADLCREICG